MFALRFDDSLSTVLAADTSTAFGAQSAWRQLVDLIGRGRVQELAPALERLAELRERVPVEVRAASARALALATPPVELVALLAGDEHAVAAPVLRTATLSAADWLSLLPRLDPRARAVLRHRRDLPAEVARGLESFGATDFVLGHHSVEPIAAAQPEAAPDPEPAIPDAPLDATPFIAVGEAARALPVVAEALKQGGEPAPRFEIADLMARIDAYQRTRPAPPVVSPAPDAPPERIRFQTDAAGVIRWVDAPARGALVGVSLARVGPQGMVELDAVAGGALRRRSAFRDARLQIGGASSIAGSWRVAGEPSYDPATGRFEGMTGVARRPRPDETAAAGASASDQLRQLLHELRTPANAIAGFAELIGSELLGPVAPVYRERAGAIQRQATDLIGAIEDLDTAARLEGRALELRPGRIDMAELVRRAAGELQALAADRGASLTLDLTSAPAHADDRAAQRLVSRLLATLVAAAQPGERLRIQVSPKTRTARLSITRPRALGAATGEALLAIDENGDSPEGALLGTGFALRLARNLAAELGGRLQIEEDRLVLRLPAAQAEGADRAVSP
jgi:signal transduction histidine kinase